MVIGLTHPYLININVNLETSLSKEGFVFQQQAQIVLQIIDPTTHTYICESYLQMIKRKQI